MKLRIALISDIHYGPDCGTKRGSQAEALFEKFAKWLKAEPHDLLVDLGDRISDVDEKTDVDSTAAVGSWFQKLEIERAHLVGNHDVEKLSVAEHGRLSGLLLQSWSLDKHDFHLVFWNLSTKLDRERGLSVPEEDLAWLESNLRATSLRTIIFSHVPLDNGSMRGNFYFEKAYPHHACYPPEQGERIRELIERSEKVVACINGHAHWNAYHSIDGIHYLTIPSLTETFLTHPHAGESWASLTLDNELHLQVHGRVPAEYRLLLKRKDSHWLNIHKAYSERVSPPK